MDSIKPDHYRGTNGKDLFWVFENFFPKQWVKGFYILNIIKYIFRHEQKNGLEDLKKSQVYVDRLVNFEESKVEE